MDNQTTTQSSNTTKEDDEGRVTLANSLLALQIIYYVIGILGMLGNSLVIYVIIRSKDLRKKFTNWYILNQSIADFSGAFLMIMTTAVEDTNKKLVGIAGDFYCRFWLTKWLLWALFMTSTYNLIAITVERYLAVVYAIWHKTSFNKTKALISIIAVWTISIIHIGSYMMIPSGIMNGLCGLFNNYASPQAQLAAALINFSILYLLPIIILIFCYSKMASVLYHRIKPMPRGTSQQNANKGTSSQNMSRAMRNVIKTLALVSICFILCFSCNQIYFLMFNLGYPADFNGAFYHFTVVALFCNCCLNPPIYIAQYEQFQVNLKRLIPWFPVPMRRNQVGTESSTVAAGSTAVTNIPFQQKVPAGDK